MIKSSLNLSEIKLALKRKDLVAKQYKLQNSSLDHVSQEYLTFLDVVAGTKVSGKIVRSSNERDHWPLLNHENVAPLFDVLNISSDLKIYMTIDIQLKLKDIIHKEDFVYNSRCLNRKKSYAKGILSGLSYIHGKSLCLMNLSDDNIYICNTHDKAVITNFSFISCSTKTTKDKLKVSELYKAPETEKHEFDATAAEMWACGTLMLDLFLAHMVPWAIIDHEPRRVMEMVNKLSLELLQAANAGSVVTVTDLIKFKAFLKCFFKESQSRITAKYASIASFLSTKLQSKQLSKGVFNSNCNCVPQQAERKCSISGKNALQSVVHKTDTNLNNFFTNNNAHDSRSEEQFDYYGSSLEIYLDSETPNWLNSNPTGSSDLNCIERDESIFTRESSTNFPRQDFDENKETMETEIFVHKNTIENVCDKKANEKSYHGPDDKEDTFSSPKILLTTTFKSCQMIKEDTNEIDFKNYHSKSLSFINHCDEINYETAVKTSYSKNYLCSSFRSLQIESNLNKSDFCLNRLFENKEWSEKSMAEKKVSHDELNTVKTRKLRSIEDFVMCKPKNPEISRRKFIESMQEIRLPSRDLSPHSNNKMSIQRIKERFAAIRRAEISLKDHKLLFISEELSDKQQNLINEYRDLLRQEKIRLCEVLSNEYKLSISEVKKLLKSFGSNSRLKKINRRSISNKLQYSSSEFSDCMLADMREREKNSYKTINYNRQTLRESEDGLKLRLRKNFSYCKAIESSANQVRTNWDKGFDTKKYPKSDKLMLTEKKAEVLEPKNGKKTTNRKTKSAQESQINKNPKSHRLTPSLEDFALREKRKDSKDLLMARNARKNDNKNDKIPLVTNKTKITRKTLCFRLCPGGKVEETSFDDLCEACKFGYGLY